MCADKCIQCFRRLGDEKRREDTYHQSESYQSYSNDYYQQSQPKQRYSSYDSNKWNQGDLPLQLLCIWCFMYSVFVRKRGDSDTLLLMEKKTLLFLSLGIVGVLYVLWNVVDTELEEDDSDVASSSKKPNCTTPFIPTHEWQEVKEGQAVPPV